MSISIPEGTPTLQRTNVMVVLTVADMLAPKLATEINHASSKNISCHLFAEAWNPTGSTGKGSRKARMCTDGMIETLQRTTYTVPDLMYTHDPQAADGAVGNEARAILVPGTVLYLVERQGLPMSTAWAVAQRTRTHKVRLGAQIRSGDLTDENGEYYISQTLVYSVLTGPVDGVIAA